jgi:hypothetical protein
VTGPPQRSTYPPGTLESDPEALFHLGPGLDIRAGSLSIILHSLKWADKPEVDIEDIKVVVSQLGSRLKQVQGPPPDREALQAFLLLRNRISQLCTTVE